MWSVVKYFLMGCCNDHDFADLVIAEEYIFVTLWTCQDFYTVLIFYSEIFSRLILNKYSLGYLKTKFKRCMDVSVKIVLPCNPCAIRTRYD
jgi:hypothetical protein